MYIIGWPRAGFLKSGPGGRCPAEFSSNPDQTNLPVTLKTLISLFRCLWFGLKLNSAGKWSSRTGSEEHKLEAGMSDPCYPLSMFFWQNMPLNHLSADPAPWPVSVVNSHSHLARKVQTAWIHGCIMDEFEQTVKLSIRMHCSQGYVSLCSYFMYYLLFCFF